VLLARVSYWTWITCCGDFFSVDDGSEYVRTCQRVSSKDKPGHILTRMTVGNEDRTHCLRNLKQIQNVSVAVNAQLIDSK